MTPEQRSRRAKIRYRRQQNRKRALELHLAGCSYDQIASEMGFKNKTTAWRLVTAALQDIPLMEAKQGRKRYEQMMMATLRRANTLGRAGKATIKDQLEANSQVMEVANALAKVMGWSAPAQHRIGGAAGAPPVSVDSTINYGDLAGLNDGDLSEVIEALGRAAQAERRPTPAVGGEPGDGAAAPGEVDSG